MIQKNTQFYRNQLQVSNSWDRTSTIRTVLILVLVAGAILWYYLPDDLFLQKSKYLEIEGTVLRIESIKRSTQSEDYGMYTYVDGYQIFYKYQIDSSTYFGDDFVELRSGNSSFICKIRKVDHSHIQIFYNPNDHSVSRLKIAE